MKEDVDVILQKQKQGDILTFDKNNNNKKILTKYLNIEGFSFFRIKERGLLKRKKLV